MNGSRPPYIHNGIPYTDKTYSYWIRRQAIVWTNADFLLVETLGIMTRLTYSRVSRGKWANSLKSGDAHIISMG